MTAAFVSAGALLVVLAETSSGGSRRISEAISLLGLGFFGVLEALSLMAIARPDRLEISPAGVSIRHLWTIRRFSWGQLGAFRLVRTAYPGRAEKTVGISVDGARLGRGSFRLTNPRWELPTAKVLTMLEEGRARWGRPPVVAPDGAPAPSTPVMLGDRMGRRSYWTFVPTLVAVFVAVSLLTRITWAGGLLGGALFVVSRGRLHDIGLSAWWSIAVIPAAVALILAVQNLSYLQHSLLPGVSLAGAGLWVSLVMALGLVIGLGAKPGDPAENRYGVAPSARPRLIF